MSSNEKLEDFLAALESEIVNKYASYAVQSKKLLCKAASNREVGSIGKPVFFINLFSLREACAEILKDIRFIFERRGSLIGPNRPSLGKIAGVIVYIAKKENIFRDSSE